MNNKNSNQKKDKRIIVRLSEEDYNLIITKATNAKISLSDYIRVTALSSKRGKPPKIEENIIENENIEDFIICPFCNSKIPANAHFCGECGNKIISIIEKTDDKNWKDF